MSLLDSSMFCTLFNIQKKIVKFLRISPVEITHTTTTRRSKHLRYFNNNEYSVDVVTRLPKNGLFAIRSMGR